MTDSLAAREPGPFSNVRTGLRQPLVIGWRWLTSAVDARREPARFASIKTYCVFLGHGRSGHSIVGAILDAHPDIIVSDELDALRYVAMGFSRNQVFSLSWKTAAAQAKAQRRKAGRGGKSYSYFVPGQWQGRARRPLVVGDSRASGSVKRLTRNPRLLDKLRARMGPVRLRFVLVVRNPFDNIATMMIRTGRSFDSAFNEYFGNWDGLATIRQRIGAGELLVVHHEALLANPQEQLARLCSYLGVEADDEYLASCANILYPSPSRSRESVTWTQEQRSLIEGRIEAIEDLRGYVIEA